MVEVNMSISQGVNKVARLNGQIKKNISDEAIERDAAGPNRYQI